MTRCTYGPCTVSAAYDVSENLITTGDYDAKSGEPIREREARRIIPGSAYCLRHARRMAETHAAIDRAVADRDLRKEFGTSGVLPGFEDGQQGRIAT